MEIRLIEESEKDLAYWKKSHNTIILKRIAELFMGDLFKRPLQIKRSETRCIAISTSVNI